MPPITNLSQLDLTKTYTYADYLTWQLDEFVELIKGKVYQMSPAPRRRHQVTARNLNTPIALYLEGKQCEVYFAPFDVRLTTAGPNGDVQITTVVQPDICVICDPAKLDDLGCLGAPDWIIEILSPGTAAHDTRDKYDLYQEAGVSEYWIVSPLEKYVSVFVLREQKYQLAGEFYAPGPIPTQTLPELEILWEKVFAGV
ncbi:Uma2 family endonuclease [Hymenobacter cavernae]|uniref:Putative restriction endonuclease domain-containing protein n=1 Tax=Hymenobacter cavernae TaxID=2044852 RepID=A0ABQ1UXT7_9BACT|nr:Uma2 family endonuclease [Hymenobacter cavernae]GGF27857.1 hypothetical protein GCM10011383_44440 [Hymenobacter cavernae]